MPGKKSDNKKKLDNELEKLYDHIKGQNFENPEELQAFLQQMVGQKLGDIVPKKRGRMSKKEESRELVYEAFESSLTKGKKLIKRALELDPDNADAYLYMADIEEDIHKALDYYKKGMAAGKKTIGEKDFKELKGHFWGFHETRPYMRAKAGYAECLYYAGKIDESIQEYAEMIELNPNDNQGVRYKYAALLVNAGRFKEYENLKKIFNDEGSALWLFTYAIYLFKKQGRTRKSDKALLDAHQANNHVVAFLTGEKEPPDMVPDYYSWGDENEAVVYLKEAVPVWIETPGALEWIHEFYDRRKNVN